MLSAKVSCVPSRDRVLALLMVIFGLAPAASAAPVVPWAFNQSFSPATAAIGTEPTSGTAGSDWGTAVTFSLANSSSFTQVNYQPSTPVFSGTNNVTPAPGYVNASTSLNLGYTGLNYYPTGPDRNTSGGTGNISPGGASTANINESGPYVASSVVVNSSPTSPYTDPYPSGTKLALSNSNAPGAPGNTFVPGTNAAIIAGLYVSSGGSLTMSWRTRSPTEMDKYVTGGSPGILPTAAAYLASDVMQLTGEKSGYDYVLQMDFNNDVETPGDQIGDIEANKALFLGELINEGKPGAQWVNAVSKNVATFNAATGGTLPAVGAFAYEGPGGTNYGNAQSAPSDVPYIGSFQSFLSSTYVQDGATHYFYEQPLDQLRGTWGIDTSTDTAWAILDDGGGIFAVVPEPATIHLLAGGLLTWAAGFWCRRRAKKARRS